MDYGFDHFETVRIARGEVPLTTAAVMEGDASAVKIGAAEDITFRPYGGAKRRGSVSSMTSRMR